MENLLVVGVGGAGCELAAKFGGSWRTLAVNTDSSALEKSGLDGKLPIGSSVCNGQPAGTPMRGRLAAQESLGELKDSLKGWGVLVLVAGLGGGTGTGAVPVIVDAARSLGIDVVVALTLPFEFEDKRRSLALEALSELRVGGVTVLVHDHASEMQDQTLQEAFDGAAQKLLEAVQIKLA